MYFGSRLKKVFMPDASRRHNTLKTWLVEEEGCSAIADLTDDEQARLKELVDRKLPPRVSAEGYSSGNAPYKRSGAPSH